LTCPDDDNQWFWGDGHLAHVSHTESD
jgi:hypothetical protein